MPSSKEIPGVEGPTSHVDNCKPCYCAYKPLRIDANDLSLDYGLSLLLVVLGLFCHLIYDLSVLCPICICDWSSP